MFIMFFNTSADLYWDPVDVKNAAQKLKNAGGDFYIAEAKELENDY